MKNALIIVDVQNDFCEGGALAVTGGNQVAAAIAHHVERNADEYDLLVTTQDWHNSLYRDPAGNCGHFAVPPHDPDYEDSWPVHCVGGEDGADYHPTLRSALVPHILNDSLLQVRKGQGVPAYSGFDGSVAAGGVYRGATLEAVLRGLDVVQVEVVGLAYDYCVQQTALAASDLGLEVTVTRALSAAVHPERAAEISNRLDTTRGITVA